MTASTDPPQSGFSRVRVIPAWVWCLFLAAALLYGVGSVWLVSIFRQHAFDLGIYEQTNWLLANGETFNTVAGIHVFGAHFSPILYLTAPLSRVAGGAVPELVFQAVWIASGVFPAYLMGRHLGHPAVYAVGYALHPGVVSGAYFGWRGWSLAVPVLMVLVSVVVVRADVKWVWAASLALLLFREDMAVWVLIVLVIAVQRSWLRMRQVIPIAAAVTLYGAIAAFVVIPGLSPTDEYLYQETFSVGASDVHSLAVVLTVYRVFYLIAPLGIAAVVVGWRYTWPLAVPLAGLVFRGHDFALLTNFHYEMLFVPTLLMIMAAAGTRFTNARVAIASSLLALAVLGPLKPYTFMLASPLYAVPVNIEEYRMIDEWIESYGSESSMSLPDRFVANHAARFQITMYPYPFDDPYPEPYLMDCSPPRVVVVPIVKPDVFPLPGWDTARADYELVETWEHFEGYVLRDESVDSAGCTPARR